MRVLFPTRYMVTAQTILSRYRREIGAYYICRCSKGIFASDDVAVVRDMCVDDTFIVMHMDGAVGNLSKDPQNEFI